MLDKIKQWPATVKTRVVGLWSRNGDDVAAESKSWIKLGVGVSAALLVLAVIMGLFWSAEPEPFSVHDNALASVGNDETKMVTGVATTATVIRIADTLLSKRGGYLSNDAIPPGVWLDNIPSWEFGVLVQIRDMNKAMREAFSRSQSQSTEDKDLALAESRFNFDNRSWLLPPTEGQYKEGIEYLQGYLDRLVDEDQQNAQFYARADNLRYWLSTVESRLGSLSQRLSASVGQKRLNTDLAGDSEATQATSAPSEMVVKTPWNKIDNEFYEARGSAWALIHMLKAIEVDFADVLEKKNARVSMQQIIRELEGTQQTVYSLSLIHI